MQIPTSCRRTSDDKTFLGFRRGEKERCIISPRPASRINATALPPIEHSMMEQRFVPRPPPLEGSVARRPPPPIADCDVDVAISNWPASSAVLPAQKSYTQIYIHCRKNTACVGMLNKEETLK